MRLIYWLFSFIDPQAGPFADGTQDPIYRGVRWTDDEEQVYGKARATIPVVKPHVAKT